MNAYPVKVAVVADTPLRRVVALWSLLSRRCGPLAFSEVNDHGEKRDQNRTDYPAATGCQFPTAAPPRLSGRVLTAMKTKSFPKILFLYRGIVRGEAFFLLSNGSGDVASIRS